MVNIELSCSNGHKSHIRSQVSTTEDWIKKQGKCVLCGKPYKKMKTEDEGHSAKIKILH